MENTLFARCRSFYFIMWLSASTLWLHKYLLKYIFWNHKKWLAFWRGEDMVWVSMATMSRKWESCWWRTKKLHSRKRKWVSQLPMRDNNWVTLLLILTKESHLTMEKKKQCKTSLIHRRMITSLYKEHYCSTRSLALANFLKG